MASGESEQQLLGTFCQQATEGLNRKSEIIVRMGKDTWMTQNISQSAEVSDVYQQQSLRKLGQPMAVTCMIKDTSVPLDTRKVYIIHWDQKDLLNDVKERLSQKGIEVYSDDRTKVAECAFVISILPLSECTLPSLPSEQEKEAWIYHQMESPEKEIPEHKKETKIGKQYYLNIFRPQFIRKKQDDKCISIPEISISKHTEKPQVEVDDVETLVAVIVKEIDQIALKKYYKIMAFFEKKHRESSTTCMYLAVICNSDSETTKVCRKFDELKYHKDGELVFTKNDKSSRELLMYLSVEYQDDRDNDWTEKSVKWDEVDGRSQTEDSEFVYVTRTVYLQKNEFRGTLRLEGVNPKKLKTTVLKLNRTTLDAIVYTQEQIITLSLGFSQRLF